MKNLSKLCLLLFLALLYSCSQHVDIDNVIWENKGNNLSILRNPSGKIIIGPAYIMLTKKNGFIIGNATEREGTFFFAIKLKDFSIVKSADFFTILKVTPFKDSSIINDFVTFGDLKGQWSKCSKLKD